MPTQYCVRLYSAAPSTTSALLQSGLNMADVYSPARFLAGWAADFSHGASDFSEQLVSFSDGTVNVTNSSQVDCRAGNWGSPDVDVAYVGLVAASSQGAHKAGLRAQATPLAVIALPGGGRKRVAGTGRVTFAPGSLVFQL